MQAPALPGRMLAAIGALCAGPVVAIFLSSNLVNLGNLAFNVLFSRWMGPVVFGQLATLLTLFLAVMGVLGALQLAVSQRIAAGTSPTGNVETGLARLSRQGLVGGSVILPILVAVIVLGNFHRTLGLGSAALIPLLLLCLPFALPLALARGVATGRLDARGVTLSAQIEMWVRLIGAAAAWQAGFGVEGVTAIIALSVLAGWVPLRSIVGTGRAATAGPLSASSGLILAALPFAMLQAGQVIMLDGDVILAQAFLGPDDAGQVAALGLFQRIQFFGCFSLAAVLLPAVAAEVSAKRNPLAAAIPVFGLFAGVSTVIIAAAWVIPGPLMTTLVGPAFLPAADLLPTVSAAAAAFTLSYLLATYLTAIGDRAGIWAVTLACPLQMLAMAFNADGLSGLMTAKLSCQLALAGWLLVRAARRSFFPPTAAMPLLSAHP